MAEERLVQVQVRLELDDLNAAREEFADLAWSHAKSAALGLNLDLGSASHVELYNQLSENYEHSVDHLMFFMTNAFALLVKLFDTNFIRLNTTDGPLDDAVVCQRLGAMAQEICRSFVHLSAGHELLWPTNEMLPQYSTAEFYFTDNEINMEEE